MKTYIVYSGEYPFNSVIGVVVVKRGDTPEEEAATALSQAVSEHGHGVVVEPYTG